MLFLSTENANLFFPANVISALSCNHSVEMNKKTKYTTDVKDSFMEPCSQIDLNINQNQKVQY